MHTLHESLRSARGLRQQANEEKVTADVLMTAKHEKMRVADHE